MQFFLFHFLDYSPTYQMITLSLRRSYFRPPPPSSTFNSTPSKSERLLLLFCFLDWMLRREFVRIVTVRPGT